MTGTSEPSVAAAATGSSAGTAQQQLFNSLALPDVDTAGARASVETAALQRRRARRVVGSAAAVILLAGCAATVALGASDPDDIVADRDDRTKDTPTIPSSTVTPSTTETTLVATTTEVVSSTVPTTVPTTTLPPDTVPSTLPPPPSTVPNQPLRAELVITTPDVQAGDNATAQVVWSDPDHAGSAPSFAVDWGDPAVAGAPSGPDPSGPCNTGGQPSGATHDLRFRYATPGSHQLSVVVTTCGGGAYGERVELKGTVSVTVPTVSGQRGRAVVAFLARGAPALPALDEAVAVFTPALTPGTPMTLPTRVPVLELFAASGPATVLRLPARANGTIRLTWPGSTCVATGATDLVTADPAATPVVALTGAC